MPNGAVGTAIVRGIGGTWRARARSELAGRGRRTTTNRPLATARGLGVGLAVLGGGLGQGMAARGTYESIARNPSAAGQIQTPFFVGMALIESLVLLAFVITIGLSGKI